MLLMKMNYKDHHNITIEEAFKLVTGKAPEPVSIEDPALLEQRELEGEMRRKHRITERSDWLAQLRRYHPNAAIPSE